MGGVFEGAGRFFRGTLFGVRAYWSLALLALALATALWVAVSDVENPPRTDAFGSKIPIEPVNVQDLFAISGGTALGNVKVTITAREDVWDELTVEDFRAVADFANAQQGDAEVPVRVEVADDRREDVTIVDAEPTVLRVRLDVRFDQRLPTRVNITGQPPIGFELSVPTIAPGQVEVSGPEALVKQVAFVEADVNLSGTTVNVVRSYRLVPRSSSGVTIDGVSLDPDTADVSVDVTQTIFDREIVVKPTVIGRLADGYQVVGVSSDPPTVVVVGTSEALQSLNFVATDPVDISGATSDVTRTLLLRLPPDLSSPGQPTVIVQVRVVASAGEAQYGVAPRVVNLGADLAVTLNTPTIVVRLEGDIPTLGGLRPRDIVVTIDASDLGPGIHSLRPEISLPSEVTLGDVSPTEVTITITRLPQPTEQTPEPTP